jgi:hypothetical protein
MELVRRFTSDKNMIGRCGYSEYCLNEPDTMILNDGNTSVGQPYTPGAVIMTDVEPHKVKIEVYCKYHMLHLQGVPSEIAVRRGVILDINGEKYANHATK